MGRCGCDSLLVFRAMPAAAAWPWLAGSLVCLYLEETTQTKAAFYIPSGCDVSAVTCSVMASFYAVSRDSHPDAIVFLVMSPKSRLLKTSSAIEPGLEGP